MSTKAERRKANFPPARVRSTLKRVPNQFADHLAPQSLIAKDGRLWRGGAARPARKRVPRRRDNWRAWYRTWIKADVAEKQKVRDAAAAKEHKNALARQRYAARKAATV